jgi:hypothetical protein
MCNMRHRRYADKADGMVRLRLCRKCVGRDGTPFAIRQKRKKKAQVNKVGPTKDVQGRMEMSRAQVSEELNNESCHA